MKTLKTLIQEALERFDKNWQEDGDGYSYVNFMETLEKEIRKVVTEAFAATEVNMKQVVRYHNARILSEFQLQGKADMPLPAMEIANEETKIALFAHSQKVKKFMET